MSNEGVTIRANKNNGDLHFILLDLLIGPSVFDLRQNQFFFYKMKVIIYNIPKWEELERNFDCNYVQLNTSYKMKSRCKLFYYNQAD